MGEAIIVAVITGGLSLIGTVITVLATSQKTEQAMQVASASVLAGILSILTSIAAGLPEVDE